MNQNIELKGKENENMFSVIDKDVLSAFFTLKELRTLYYEKLEILKKNNPNFNYDIWDKEFDAPYKDLWCDLENMLGSLITLNMEIDSVH